MDNDLKMILLAVEAAKQIPRENVHPNPKVGATLVSTQGQVVVAAHEKCGGDHAEVAVIKKAQQSGVTVEGATLYVTLEPCSHFGKTPPCARAIVDHKIKRVVVAVGDSSKKVNGQGLEILKSAGIDLQLGVGAAQARDLNKEWLLAHRLGRPFVRVKMATSLDGLWTSESGKSQWITGESARALAQEIRGWADILVTSTQTIFDDNPKMTARKAGQLMSTQPKILIPTKKKDFDLHAYEISKHPGGTSLFPLKDSSKSELKRFLEETFLNTQSTHLFLEAGPTLTHAFLEAGLWDEIYHFLGPLYLGGQGKRMPAFHQGQMPGLSVLPFGAQPFEDSSLLLKFYNSQSL